MWDVQQIRLGNFPYRTKNKYFDDFKIAILTNHVINNTFAGFIWHTKTLINNVPIFIQGGEIVQHLGKMLDDAKLNKYKSDKDEEWYNTLFDYVLVIMISDKTSDNLH